MPDTPAAGTAITVTPALRPLRGRSTTPPALAAYRADALRKFAKIPAPAGGAEAWRFSPPPPLDPGDFPAARPVASRAHIAGIAARSTLVSGPVAATLVFVNGRLAASTPLPDNLLAQGVHFAPIGPSLEEHGGLADLFASQRAPLGSEQALALCQANLGAGYVLRVPDGVEIEDPFVIYHWIRGRNSSVFPAAAVLAGAGARMNIAEFHLAASTRSHGTLAASTAAIHAGPDSMVRRVSVQNWGGGASRSWQIETLHADRGATLDNISINLGAAWARQEIEVRLNGPGAAAHPCGITIADGTQHFDQRTLQVHNAPDTTSNLLFKNVLLGRARTIFSGLIQVAPEAQRTDAYQTNRNLRLSPDAEAISMPGLEIAANDVKCSHGATNSGIDPGELFYLHARGIPSDAARGLLVFGFFEDILARAPSRAIASALRELIRQKLEIQAPETQGR
jgi:Fe-S cluster assembly protein SufD